MQFNIDDNKQQNMFSGIIQAIGTIHSTETIQGDLRLCINAGELPTADFNIGDSIAVNGVCLTLIQQQGGLLGFDVSNETLSCSNLGNLQVNSRVNLEPALKLADRINGHLVTGHIDTVAELVSKQGDARSWRCDFKLEPDVMRYICVKGSIAVDGVSLTVNSVKTDGFSVNIIPHTLQQTLFNDYRVSSIVNIELDMMARYLERLLDHR